MGNTGAQAWFVGGIPIEDLLAAIWTNGGLAPAHS
jgi:hypothetical protein